MEGDPKGRVQAIDEQIQRLLALRRQWAEERGLSHEQRRKRGPALELLDGAIEDLKKKRRQLLPDSSTAPGRR